MELEIYIEIAEHLFDYQKMLEGEGENADDIATLIETINEHAESLE